MTETHGVIQHVELAPQLWCVVFFPLAAAIAISYFGLTLGSASEKEKTDTDQTIARVAVAGPFLALLTSLYYAFSLSQLAPNSRYFLLHFSSLLRIGQFDANVDFALDPLSASFAVVIAALGGAVTLLLTSRSKDGKKIGSWRSYARINACIAAALFFVLADNLPLALIGWGATGALVSSLAVSKTDRGARTRRISFVAARAGDAAFLVAAASLFWTFGGTFADGDYIPDLDARYAAVSNVAASTTSTGHATPNAKSSVTLASTPGALLFVDESRTPLENSGAPARAPAVRQSVDAGMHTFRVHPGSGLDDSIVAHVRLAEGAEVAIVLVGATANFREMRDQLVLTDDHGTPWRKDALIARRSFGSLGAVTFGCLLILIAAAIRGAAVPFEAWLAGAADAAAIPNAVLVQGIALCTGIYLLARVSFLFELSPVASTVVALLGALTAVVSAIAMLSSTRPLRTVGYLACTQFGFAVMALGAGSPIIAVILAATATFAIAGLALSVARVSSPDGLQMTRVSVLALAVAPIPGAGISFMVIRAIGAAGVSDSRWINDGAQITAIYSAGLVSYVLWKMLYLASKKDDKKPEKTAPKNVIEEMPPLEKNLVIAFLGAAFVLGLVFDLGAVSGHPFTSDGSMLASWLAPGLALSSARESSGFDAIIFAMGFGATLAGYAQVRVRAKKKGAFENVDKMDERLDAWEKSRTADGGLVARIATSLVERASLLARDTDRFVIDGVIGAAAGIIRLASRLTGGRGHS